MYIKKGLDHFTNVNYVSPENIVLNSTEKYCDY